MMDLLASHDLGIQGAAFSRHSLSPNGRRAPNVAPCTFCLSDPFTTPPTLASCRLPRPAVNLSDRAPAGGIGVTVNATTCHHSDTILT